ncbi:hypothetical protein FUAX_13290 [Fulvitalea axinellae]|uniref:Uncharacterized protein n=1 Tax=Fulvitalea axinellae TaxID=1182444 RepID=A0AAU9CPP0_9BACT|nr:hypothetical protein FUAX_13290 [Fulvitalea axinellae]
MIRKILIVFVFLVGIVLSDSAVAQSILLKDHPKMRMLLSFYRQAGRYKAVISFVSDSKDVTQLNEGDDVELTDVYTGDVAVLRVEDVVARKVAGKSGAERYQAVYRINTVDRWFVNYFGTMIIDRVDLVKTGVSFLSFLPDQTYKDSAWKFAEEMKSLGGKKMTGDHNQMQILTMPTKGGHWSEAEKIDDKTGIVTMKVAAADMSWPEIMVAWGNEF